MLNRIRFRTTYTKLQQCARSLCTKIVMIGDKEFEVPAAYVPPSYDLNSIKNGSPVLLMRHANSIFNMKYVELNEVHGYTDPIRDLFLEEEYRDSELSEFGIAQAVNASQYANELEIDTVIISPLARAIQTAYHWFKSHKDFENIKFVIHPDAREHLFGTGEMTMGIADKIENTYNKMFPNLNTDLMLKDPGNKESGYDEMFYCRDMQQEVTSFANETNQGEIDKL